VDTNAYGFASGKEFVNAAQLSSGGGVVAFDCSDSDLVMDDSNNRSDVFVRELSSGTLELISGRDAALPSGTPAAVAFGPLLSASADGRFVAFGGSPGALVSGCTNPYRAIIVRDLSMGTNLLASVDTNGLATLDRNALDPCLSSDGRFVAFSTSASNLVLVVIRS